MNDIPIIRGLSRLAGTISAPAAGNMAREAIKKIFALPPNIPLGIFPEGYEPLINMRAPLPLCSFHRGFAYIAARTAKPILPISIIPIHEYPVEYPFPISIRKLFIPHKELCELKTRITYKKVAVVFHPPVPPPNRSASRSELLDFGSHIQVIVSKPLEAYFLESQDEHK